MYYTPDFCIIHYTRLQYIMPAPMNSVIFFVWPWDPSRHHYNTGIDSITFVVFASISHHNNSMDRFNSRIPLQVIPVSSNAYSRIEVGRWSPRVPRWLPQSGGPECRTCMGNWTLNLRWHRTIEFEARAQANILHVLYYVSTFQELISIFHFLYGSERSAKESRWCNYTLQY